MNGMRWEAYQEEGIHTFNYLCDGVWLFEDLKHILRDLQLLVSRQLILPHSTSILAPVTTTCMHKEASNGILPQDTHSPSGMGREIAVGQVPLLIRDRGSGHDLSCQTKEQVRSQHLLSGGTEHEWGEFRV
jgi:hypothetical protein